MEEAISITIEINTIFEKMNPRFKDIDMIAFLKNIGQSNSSYNKIIDDLKRIDLKC